MADPLLALSPAEILRILHGLDGSDEVAYEAALNQISRCGPAVFSTLCQVLQNSLHPHAVREAAAWMLGDLHFSHSATVLAQVALDPGTATRLRATLCTVLAHVDEEPAGSALAQLARDRFVEVRRAAVTALHDHPQSSAFAVVLGALKDPDSSVRSAAAYAIETFESGQAVGPLMEALRDPDPAVRGNAASALSALGAETAGPNLIRLTQDTATYPRSAAAAALGRLRYKAAIPRLCELLQDSQDTVRRAAIRSLSRMEESATPR